jgi:hypothetical protein
MQKEVDLVRKDCLINNLENSTDVTITVNDIEHNIKKCPRGKRIFTFNNDTLINKKCLISDLHRKVLTYNTNYADLYAVIKNCAIYNTETFQNNKNTMFYNIFVALFFIVIIFNIIHKLDL